MHLLAPFWLKVGCRVFVLFFLSVFWRFLTCFWLVFCVNFTCFSRPYSNCVFAYFFLGRFSNVCTLSKHGIFKTHCFSRVKTLFWRNRLCRRNLRILIFGGGIVLCFLLNFQVFWRVFRHRFSHRFFDAFLTKKRSKMYPKLSTCTPLNSTFFEVAIFCGIFVDFGLTFGGPLGPFVLILAPFWLILGPFRCPSGSYWDRFGAI